MEDLQLDVDNGDFPVYIPHSDPGRTLLYGDSQEEITKVCAHLGVPTTNVDAHASDTLVWCRQDPRSTQGNVFESIKPTAVPCETRNYLCAETVTDEEQFPLMSLEPTSTRIQDKEKGSVATDLILVSMLQAQLCMEELQDEIDKKEKPWRSPETFHYQEKGSLTGLDPYNEDQEDHMQEKADLKGGHENDEDCDEDDEEIQDESLFCENPLFMGTPPPQPVHPHSHTYLDLRTTRNGFISCDEDKNLADGLECGQTLPATVLNAWDNKDNSSSLYSEGQVMQAAESLEILQIVEDWEQEEALSNTLSRCKRSPPVDSHCIEEKPVCSYMELQCTEPSQDQSICSSPGLSFLDQVNTKYCKTRNLPADDCLSGTPVPEQSSPWPEDTLPVDARTSFQRADEVEEGLLFSPSSSFLVSALFIPNDSDHYVQAPLENPPALRPQEMPLAETRDHDLGDHLVCQGCQDKEQAVRTLASREREEEESVVLVQHQYGPEIISEEHQDGPEIFSEEHQDGPEIFSEEHQDEPVIVSEEHHDGPEIVTEQINEEPTQIHMETSGSKEVPNGHTVPNGNSQDLEAARRLASKLFKLDGFERSQVAPYLQKNNEFSAKVAEEYLSFFDFTGKPLDAALRSLLQELVLTGETQERERVLLHFSSQFHSCNPKDFVSADAVHTLTCAIMLLNSDLHGQNIGKSMSLQDFINNLEGMNDGSNFPRDILKALYNSIRNVKLEWAISEGNLANTLVPKPENNLSSRKKSNPFLDVLAPDPDAPIYKSGTLQRKVHADIDGKRTPWGKRGWKSFYTVLKGMLLFLLKDEYRADWQSPEEVISLHHALAEQANEYTKKQYVFRLQTADWRVLLFQAQTAEEMNSWIHRVNLVAAMFSSPPFPAAIGSQKKFVRPILPSTQCKLDLEEQLQSHETWMDTFTDDLTEHQRNLPDGKSKTRDWEDFHVKEEYLRYEKTRYETYVKLLALRMQGGCEDIDTWESMLTEPDGASEETNGELKRSHSSPSLNAESSPVVVKVKRNISERRTYRRIIPKRNKNLV
ncbi:PH and SEC7 domain-containing protein 2 isoform X2 [Xenopus laevis]|uniref:PH and SEC7 domain-containing protein 2 isoform X2 n=1 Tax=Xenopus laevis TaxID=8355 RepID=A0A8J0UKX7_XENLA|nr:PH and SEC7 domain-containing protein 2 isoform X2 [Xenopus laevis]